MRVYSNACCVLICITVLNGCSRDEIKNRDMQFFFDGLKTTAVKKLGQQGELSERDVEQCASEYFFNANIVDQRMHRAWKAKKDLWGHPLEFRSVLRDGRLSSPFQILSRGSDGVLSTQDDISIEFETLL